MMNIRFGDVQKITGIFKNPPPPLKQDYTQPEYDAHCGEFAKAMARFQDRVQTHVDQLLLSHQGEKDYQAQAFPMGSYESLVVDGPDLAKLLLEIQQRKATYLSAFTYALQEQVASGKRTNRVMEDSDLEKVPPVSGYNLGLARIALHHTTYARLESLAQSRVMYDHLDNAPSSIHFEV